MTIIKAYPILLNSIYDVKNINFSLTNTVKNDNIITNYYVITYKYPDENCKKLALKTNHLKLLHGFQIEKKGKIIVQFELSNNGIDDINFKNMINDMIDNIVSKLLAENPKLDKTKIKIPIYNNTITVTLSEGSLINIYKSKASGGGSVNIIVNKDTTKIFNEIKKQFPMIANKKPPIYNIKKDDSSIDVFYVGQMILSLNCYSYVLKKNNVEYNGAKIELVCRQLELKYNVSNIDSELNKKIILLNSELDNNLTSIIL